jgi:hypothetical protein
MDPLEIPYQIKNSSTFKGSSYCYSSKIRQLERVRRLTRLDELDIPNYIGGQVWGNDLPQLAGFALHHST